MGCKRRHSLNHFYSPTEPGKNLKRRAPLSGILGIEHCPQCGLRVSIIHPLVNDLSFSITSKPVLLPYLPVSTPKRAAPPPPPTHTCSAPTTCCCLVPRVLTDALASASWVGPQPSTSRPMQRKA